jgi:hypothetical protein
MTTASCYSRIAMFLIVPLLFATTVAAQQNEKQAVVTLTVDPARITLNPGQAYRFSAHLDSAPPGTSIRWVITDKRSTGSSISQDGVFKAGVMGVYHVRALATIGESTVLKTAAVKVMVLGQLEF